MDDDYFSIDSILAENQKIQCIFTQDIPDMGHLGGGSERDITKGTRLQIPMWLAWMLIFSDFADFNIPTAFNSKVRNALSADPKSVKLSSLVGAGGLWYSFGRSVMEKAAGEQGQLLSDVLKTTFHGRLPELIDQAQHFATLRPTGSGSSSGDTAQVFREGLDGTERDLFTLAQENAKRIRRWYEQSDKARS